MSAPTKQEIRYHAPRLRAAKLEEALYSFSSNLYSLLVKKSGPTRYLKVLHFPDGHWLAIAGSESEYGEPIVAFGNGEDCMMALESLGKAMAGGKWKEDKYAKPKP